jgi:hypothetical protein
MGTLEHNLFLSRGSSVYDSILWNAVACKLHWDAVSTWFCVHLAAMQDTVASTGSEWEGWSGGNADSVLYSLHQTVICRDKILAWACWLKRWSFVTYLEGDLLNLVGMRPGQPRLQHFVVFLRSVQLDAGGTVTIRPWSVPSTFFLIYCDVLPVNASNNLWVEDFVSRFIGYTSGGVYNHL